MTLQYYIILALLASIIQTSDVVKLFDLVNQVKPDFMFLVVVYINLREKDPVTGEATAFLMGLVADVFTAGLIGLNAFTFTVSAFIINSVKEHLSMERFLPVFVFVSSLGFACEFLYLFLQRIFIGEIMFFKNLFTLAIWDSLYTGFIAWFLFFVMDKGLGLVRRWKS
jgi:rod shape-determining protein MreD